MQQFGCAKYFCVTSKKNPVTLAYNRIQYFFLFNPFCVRGFSIRSYFYINISFYHYLHRRYIHHHHHCILRLVVFC